MINAEVITLDQQQLDKAQSLIPKNSHQARHLVKYLSSNPRSETLSVNKSCSIGNIAHVARIANKHLFDMGIQLACERPEYDIFNQFGESSNQYLWSVYKPLVAANDSEYRNKQC